MLIQAFPKLKDNFFCSCIASFFHSPVYAVLVVGLMVCSETMSRELEVYYLYLAFLLFGFLFSDDALPGVPIACCAYMTLSKPNNPIKHLETTAFRDPAFLIQFVFILAVALFLVVAKFVSMVVAHRTGLSLPRLLGGLIVLGIAYLLGGVFAVPEPERMRSALFGLVQFLAIAFFYTFFVLAVDWDRLRKSYLPILFFAIGVGMCFEIAGMYPVDKLFSATAVSREDLYTGWGVYNNVACIMAMCLPAPCYFAATRKRGWPYTVVAAVFYFFLCLTQSRGGILFGTVEMILCGVYVLLACRREARQGHLLVTIFALLALLFVLLFLHDEIERVFSKLIEAGVDPSHRDTIYKNCWEAFLGAPWFGVGFYKTPGFTFDQFAGFMPPRAHNTYLQILASCGLLGFAAYCLHRFDTVVLYLSRPTHEKTFILLSVLALLLTSIVDCNFFNFGPGIIYGVMLAFAEGHSKKKYRHKPLNSYTVMPECLRGQHLKLPY